MTKEQIDKAVAEGKTVYTSGGGKIKPKVNAVKPKVSAKPETVKPEKDNKN